MFDTGKKIQKSDPKRWFDGDESHCTVCKKAAKKKQIQAKGRNIFQGSFLKGKVSSQGPFLMGT